MLPRKWSSTNESSAASTARASSSTSCWSTQPLEHDALGDVAVADRARERRHRALADLAGGQLADDART